MRRAVVVGLPTVALLTAMYTGFQRLALPSQPPQARTYRLQFEGNRLISGPAVLVAGQGDTITLLVTSDSPAVLHLHEHEQAVVLDLVPGREASSRFTASPAGRFGVHLIGSNGSFAEVAVLQVWPR